MPNPRCRPTLAILLALLVLAILGCATPFASLGTGAAGQPATATPQATTAPPHTPKPTPTPGPTCTAPPTRTPSPTATPEPPPSPTPQPPASATALPLEAEVALDAPRITQGRTGLLRVTANRPATVTGALQGSELRFASADGLTHLALFGVPASAEAGSWPLEVSVRGDDGARLRLLTALEITAGEFHTEVLTFEPEVDLLLDPEITRPEYLRLQEVFGGFADELRWQGLWRWPLESVYVTSPFGARRQYGDRPPGSYHGGVDLRGAAGVPVYAAAPGTVSLADALQVRGNAVIIDHGLGVFSGYFHLDGIEVEVGQAVQDGERIGTVGATGLVTGPHLHWEVRVGGVSVDPTEWTERPLDGSSAAEAALGSE